MDLSSKKSVNNGTEPKLTIVNLIYKIIYIIKTITYLKQKTKVFPVPVP